MKKAIHLIPLNKIRPMFKAKVSDVYLRRMKKTNNNLLDYDLLLAVEKDSKEEFYWLVGGYDTYYFLTSSKIKFAPCIIEDSNSIKSEREVKILRRLFNKGDSIKQNRQGILDLLNKAKIPIDYIIKKTGFTKSEIEKNYEYHKNIPKKYINQNTSEKTLNWIESLIIEQDVKEFLFVSAGLPIGNSKRLTHDNMKIIKSFLKEESRFDYLTSAQKIKLLSYAISFKGAVLDWLRCMVTEFTKPHRAL